MKVDPWEIVPKNLDILGNNVGLYGPPGTGKTALANKAPDDWAVYNITITEETSAAELRGHWVQTGNTWDWMDGTAVAAWRESHHRPTRLVVNEIHKCQGDAATFLHVIAEDISMHSTNIRLPNREQEIVRPGPQFQLVVTMNDDPDSLDVAFADRFAWFNITTVNPEAILALPRELRTAAEQTCNQSDWERRLSLRAWFRYAKLLEHKMNKEEAAYSAFGHRYAEILDAMTMARASAGTAACKRPPTGKILNGNFDREFSAWDDLVNDGAAATVFCYECAGSCGHITEIKHKVVWFYDVQECEDFQEKYSIEEDVALTQMSLIHRTAYKTAAAVKVIAEEMLA